MESSSNANAALTKATNKRKKTRAEMDAHNARCRSSRLRTKIRNSQTREENERIKKEMEEKTSELQQRVENEMLKHKRAVEEKRAIEAQMRQFPTSLKFEGQIFSTSEQMKKYILSRTYEPHHQGLDNTNITASDPRPSFVANNIGFDAPDNNLSSCDPAAGPDNTNITASDSRPSFVANNIAFDAPNNNLSFCDPAAGVPDFDAGFSFDANDDEFFEWMTLIFDTAAGISETTNLVVENQNSELVNQIDHNALSDHSSCDPAAGPYNTNITACVPCPSFVANYKCFDVPNNKLSSSDHVAGISQTKNSVVEIHNNELVNQIDHKAMVQRSELSPAQRSAEKERDRQHMPEYKMELERLRKVEAKYKEVVPLLNTMSQLAEESKQMNDTEPYLARRIQEVDNIRQHIQEMHNKSFDHGSESSHTVMYTAELVQDFIEKLDVKEKSKVDFPDFEGLEEELEKSGSRSLPHSLVPIDMILKKHYGDITAESNQSTPLIRASYILFCSVIKEMDQLQLEQLDLDKMILWRDAINSGLSIGFKASFAIEHLKNIARAYFGSKERESMKERMLKLKTDLRIAEMQSSEMCSNGPHDFQGKPVSTGLWRAQSIL